MKTLTLSDGRQLTYHLKRKAVKNINFRVKSDGVVYVSAKNSVGIAYIENILIGQAEQFLAAAERLRQREERSEIAIDRVNWLGREYPVRIIASHRECAVLDDNELRVFSVHGEDEMYIRGLMEKTIQNRFVQLCGELDREVRSALGRAGLTPPPTKVTVKDMKTRWGSCSYNRGHISINLRLAAYPRETVLSVFWHEYAHYWHHDHSSAFYAFLDKHYPEYRRWNGILK